jgi:PAS domain S-box-containing protein
MNQNIHPKSKTESKDGKRTFYLLFMGHSTPMYVYDLQTLKILEVNDAALEKYQYPRDEFLSLTVRDMVLPGADVPFSSNGDDDRREPHYTGRLQHKCKNGERIDVEYTIHIIDFNARKAALAMTRDITEIKLQ